MIRLTVKQAIALHEVLSANLTGWGFASKHYIQGVERADQMARESGLYDKVLFNEPLRKKVEMAEECERRKRA